MRQDELYEDMTADHETEAPSIVTSHDNLPKEKWLKKRTMYKVKVRFMDEINLLYCLRMTKENISMRFSLASVTAHDSG